MRVALSMAMRVGAEVGDGLEDGCGSEVPPGVDDASLLVDAADIDAQLLLEDVELAVEVECGVGNSRIEIVAYLLEDPGPSEGV